MDLLEEREGAAQGLVRRHAVLRRARRLGGELTVPSDKSIAHRALIMGALALGTTRITLREAGADVRATISALASLGVSAHVAEAGAGAITVVLAAPTDGGQPTLRPGDAYCANSGTTMRLLAGAGTSAVGGTIRLTGDASLSHRPMERVAAPLRAMGADVRTSAGLPPVVVRGGRRLRAVAHELPVASAQVLAAVSLAALGANGTTSVAVPGPTRDHTERMLRLFGAHVAREPAGDGGGTRTEIEGPAMLRGLDVAVPGDLSSAAAWAVAAAVHDDADVSLRLVGLNPTRTAVVDVLEEMGAHVWRRVAETGPQPPHGMAGEPVGDIGVRSGARLKAVRIDATRVPALIDELPLIAVAMAAADGTSEVRGAAELRVKESDRIALVCGALVAAGAQVEELPDGWRIRRGRPRDAVVTTGGDHRIAMASAVAAWAGVARSVVLDDAGCVAVSYPSFWRDAQLLGATT